MRGLILLVAACGRIGFDNGSAPLDEDASVQPPDDVFVGGGFTHLGTLGTAACTSPLVVTLQTDVPAGSTILARVVLRAADTQTQEPKASDPANNIYRTDVVARMGDFISVTAMLGAYVDNALSAGQTITFTDVNAHAQSVVIEAFTGISRERLVTSSIDAGRGALFDASIATSEPNVLVYCGLGLSKVLTSAMVSWSPLTTRFATCGGAAKDNTSRGGVILAPTAGTYRCMGMSGDSDYAVAAVAYR